MHEAGSKPLCIESHMSADGPPQKMSAELLVTDAANSPEMGLVATNEQCKPC